MSRHSDDPISGLNCTRLFKSTTAVVSFLILELLLCVFSSTLARSETMGAPSSPPIIFVEAPLVTAGRLMPRFPQGSHLARIEPGAQATSAVNLTPGFFAVADPQVSFDATKVLFAGEKEPNSTWQIWEMNVDGSDKHQLTHCSADCFQPAYLPQHRIVFTMAAGKGVQKTTAIYVSEENGADAHPITFGPGNFQVETVLQNGRILVSANSPLAAANTRGKSRALYTIRPDGSGLSLFRPGSQGDIVPTGATELEDGTVLFVKRHEVAGHSTDGQLAWVRPGALHNSVITTPNSVYWSVHLLDGNRVVAARADSASTVKTGKFGLYVFNLDTKSIEKTLYRNPEFSSVQAVPLEPHPVPLYYWSILHPDWNYGRVVCLNSYLSADAPNGRLPGHIAQVRVIALQPDHTTEQILGEAPVESDGSFYIKVPADHPVRFELLSPKGAVIHAQKSWIWARPGEDVPCLGCHESKVLVPADNWPLALRRQAGPIPVGMPLTTRSANH